MAELTHLSKMAKIGEPTINLRHLLSHARDTATKRVRGARGGRSGGGAREYRTLTGAGSGSVKAVKRSMAQQAVRVVLMAQQAVRMVLGESRWCNAWHSKL